MQDNSTDDMAEMLIRYMDGELNAAEREAAEKLLREDAALQERYQYFLAAKRAIKAQALKQRVQAVHQAYMQEVKPQETHPANVVKPASFPKRLMRVAAILIVVIAGYGVFQYTSTTNQSVYNDHFIAYQLPVNRSNERSDSIDALYNAGNFNAVISTFNELQQKNQKDYFLAAQSYLQLNNADAAINLFRQVEDINNNSTDKYFVQETDYYLLLAYIKAGKIDLAKKQQDKIISNKQHLFYAKAKNISSIKLMMLKWKDK